VTGVYKKYQEKGFHIIGLECQGSSNADIGKYVKDKGIAYQVVTGGDLKGANVSSIPHGFLFGPDGKLAVDNPRGKQLEDKIQVLLYDVPKQKVNEPLRDVPKQEEKKKEPTRLITLKDGTKITAAKIVDFGETYSIKSTDGKFSSVNKADVEKIETGEQQ